MMWGGENLKRATEAGDFIEFLIKEMKVLADEIDRFLEVAPDITMIRIVAGDEYLPCFALILQQYTIFQPLSGIHPQIINHPDFRLVDYLKSIICQNLPQLLLLLTTERQTADADILFFTLTAKENCPERVFIIPKVGQGGKDFAEAFDFPVMGGNRTIGFAEMFGKVLRVLKSNIANRHSRIIEKMDKLQQ